jgi:hypothetical protein
VTALHKRDTTLDTTLDITLDQPHDPTTQR